ncbi:DUF4189 domain-containing protein [Falsiroseomonas selenitidurans]|uniref:DUF4189 domain-containing protein n=1 Tax=Falsiroseomonas selenitidurans TaxID=2716335 RepID=A0ABX1E313_9PROT|nr:DUF4189 domain-containing protein [Falsiroseomonas selenitidurans]NKC31401.1 DUF4189 domain-containing protein [Falsiroseomonas selenitidurans]
MRPALIRIAFTLLSLTLPGLAEAQGQRGDAGAQCRAECGRAASRQPGAGPQAAQACTIRCQAGLAFLASQGRGPAPAASRGVRRPQAVPVAMRPTSPPARAARPAPAARPLASPVPAPRGNLAVLYAARSPSAGFGLVVGEPDRMAAHRLAERACTSGGPGCRPVAEFNAACAAAAHGVQRSQWAMFMTSDPSSFTVTSISAGAGATQAEAERAAVAECRSRDRTATCRIAAAACRG